ncbi:MAG TPA: hypothetical protein ENF16_06560 [Bacteroidetes bacterium]|nr:hypothetical protein [Bacteroidota bacterium]
MKTNETEVDTKLKKLVSILKKHGIKKISIFGSYARGMVNAESDLDVLVEFSGKKSLLDIIGIEMELSEALKLKVDLLTDKSISPYLIDRIKKEAKVIYG